MAQVPETYELAPGQRLLDRYSIVDKAGRGGMATIYRANDERLDRTVCVKLLRTVVDGGNGGRSESDGGAFLLPYWMGRYLKFLLGE